MNNVLSDKPAVLNAIEFFKGFFNITDIIILLFIAYCSIIGYKNGLMKTLFYALKILASMILAFIIARIFSPILAENLAKPIITQIFENNINGILSITPDITSKMQNIITQSAIQITGSVIFAFLFLLSAFIINFIIGFIERVTRIINRVPVLSTLNKIGGFFLGIFVSVLICIITFAVLRYFAPDIFGKNGYLSPQNVEKTKITSYFIGLVSSIRLV